jgi:nucleoside transporter
MANRTIIPRLAIMMFLEYAVRGMWYPFLANYLSAPTSLHGLGFTSGQTGWVLGFANAVGAITAPFIAGQTADRFLNAEKALAILHVIAASLLFLNASSTSFTAFFGVMLCFSVVYVPTQSLANSLALSHLNDRQRSFPRVRMWGTIGWIATSSLFTYIVLRSNDHATNIARIPCAMRAAATLAVCYAAYSFFLLPATPPADTSRGPLISIRASEFLRQPSVLILMLVAIPIAAIHTAYYLNIGPYLSADVGIPLKFVGPTLAVSQISEVVVLFLLGSLLRRFGFAAILAIGAAAQAIRFMIFALNPPAPIVILALSLHGIAFACFFTTAILYVERVFPARIRHSAQTIFGIVLFGLGPALAGPYSQLFDRFTVHTANGSAPNFRAIWWIQTAIAAGSAVFIVLFFRQSNRPTAESSDIAPLAAGIEP